jgi:peptide deformylase
MKILTINNKQEEKFLRKRAADFDFTHLSAGSNLKFTKKEIQELIKNMRTIMKTANGIGLSANQIGLDMQLFVAELPSQSSNKKTSAPKFYAVFNPKLSKPSEKKSTTEEGCLSVPGIWGNVERPEKITLSGFNKDGKEIKIKAIGLLARIFQHETDHLNGTLFIDKATSLHKHEPKRK